MLQEIDSKRKMLFEKEGKPGDMSLLTTKEDIYFTKQETWHLYALSDKLYNGCHSILDFVTSLEKGVTANL